MLPARPEPQQRSALTYGTPVRSSLTATHLARVQSAPPLADPGPASAARAGCVQPTQAVKPVALTGHAGKAGSRAPDTKPLAFQAPSHSLSQAFHSRAGKAFLLDECVNVHLGKEEERLMTTGEAGCSVVRPVQGTALAW